MDEEKELAKVLADYKKKHDEFSKAMKKSRETFKVYEGEIKNLNHRASELVQLKKRILNGPGGKGKAHQKTFETKVAEVEKIQSDWVKQKEALLKEKDQLLLVSKELQEKIKAIKEGAQNA